MPPPRSSLTVRVTTNISPLTSLTLLLMTPRCPKHFPPPALFSTPCSGFPPPSRCSHDSAEIRPLPPISYFPPFFFSFFFERIIVFPRGRNKAWPFLFPRLSRLPSDCPPFLLSSAVLVATTPCATLSPRVHPFLRSGTSRGSGSQVTLKNLADGRKIGDTYIIHCALFALFPTT